MARAPKIVSSSSSEGIGKGVVIVGGGSGAFHSVESLRENGYKGSILILTKETYMPIDRTKLSKALITDSKKIELLSAADLKIKYGVTVRSGVTVSSIDAAGKSVTFASGLSKESITYDKLILAPGGSPRRLPIEGAELENVYTLRGVEDSVKIDAAAQEGKRVVVIGSSFISMEIVAAISKRKLASIDVVGMEEFPFEAVLGKVVGKGLKTYHEAQGVKFHMQSKIEKIVPSTSTPTIAGGVVVNGETLPADFVIMGTGVAPATEFLKESAGFQLEKDGGVSVDELLRVKSVGGGDIYAIGDIAHYPDHAIGNDVRIEHWNVAGNHGRAVGKTISGSPQPFVKVPIFWSAQGQQLRYCGHGVGHDEVFVKGDPGELKFIAYYFKEGKVVAVASMQNDPVVSKASELMRLGMMPNAQEIKEGKDLSTINISTKDVKGKVESA